MTIICINGYDQPENCDHCGRWLKHGVRTNTHGTIGADCFVKLIKADKKRYSGNGKPSTAWVRELALKVERRTPEALSRMGLGPHHFRFELAA